MIVYTTKLPLRQPIEKAVFAQMVIDWIQGSRNPIIGFEWNHSNYNCKYQNDTQSIQIEYIRKYDITAIRIEQGVEKKYTTVMILNNKEHVFVAYLEYISLHGEDIGYGGINQPNFITKIVDGGYIESNAPVATRKNVEAISLTNYMYVADVINNGCVIDNPYYNVPIPLIYISKSFRGELYIDSHAVGRGLAGNAYIVYEQDDNVTATLRNAVKWKNPFDGYIGIYFPSKGKKALFINPEDVLGLGDRWISTLIGQIKEYVFSYMNLQQLDIFDTWEGLQTELYRLRYESQKNKKWAARVDAGQNLEGWENAETEIDILRKELENANREIMQLNQRNFYIKEEYKQTQKTAEHQGNEEIIFNAPIGAELYEDEFRDIILECLNEYMSNKPNWVRQVDIIRSILECNDYDSDVIKSRHNKLKGILKGGKKISTREIHELEKLGVIFESEHSTHYKAHYYGDKRYPITIACTPSEHRAAENAAHQITKFM